METIDALFLHMYMYRANTNPAALEVMHSRTVLVNCWQLQKDDRYHSTTLSHQTILLTTINMSLRFG